MDYGFEAAGFSIAVALDIDPIAAQTYTANRPEVPYIIRDIASVSSEEILKVGKLKEGEASLLIGGPPCQPFSKAGYWVLGDSGRLEDPRAATLQEYFRVVKETLPEVIVLENVHGIVYSGKEEGLLFIFDQLEQINRERGSPMNPTGRSSTRPIMEFLSLGNAFSLLLTEKVRCLIFQSLLTDQMVLFPKNTPLLGTHSLTSRSARRS